MNSTLTYKFMSSIYDLLDVVYFRNGDFSPRKVVLNAIPKGKQSVLDICTGTATNIINIADKRQDVKLIGIDLSKEMLTLAKRKISKSGLRNVKLKLCDATKTGFPDESFDVILISLVLHESSKELAKNILDEAHRLLKEDGKLIITEWEEVDTWFKKMMFFPIRKLEPKGFEQFLKLDLEQYFYKHGFKISNLIHCDYTKVIELKKGRFYK